MRLGRRGVSPATGRILWGARAKPHTHHGYFAVKTVESSSSARIVVLSVIYVPLSTCLRQVDIFFFYLFNSGLMLFQGWNGHFWTNISLSSLGLVYQLGHGGGPCIAPAHSHEMTVLHLNGIHTLRVSYCGCSISDHEGNLHQLMRNAWYPATTIDPHTCATYRVLESFRLLNVVGNVNVRDYVTTLEELTSATRTEWIAVRNPCGDALGQY